MDLLFEILTVAPKLAEFLSHSPTTFDAMMDVSFFIPPLEEQDFLQELTYQIRPHFSYQKHMDIIRRFNREQKFRHRCFGFKKKDDPFSSKLFFDIIGTYLSALERKINRNTDA